MSLTLPWRRRSDESKRYKQLLLRASTYGDMDVIRGIHSEGRCDVSVRDYRKNTPLHLASQRGQLAVIKFLIETDGVRGCDIEALNNQNNTPLHLAAWNGHIEVVRFLIEKCAKLDPESYNGSAPLHMASVTGFAEVVSLLCESGANVNAVADNDRLPIHSAARKGESDIVRLLVENGSKIFQHDMEGLDPLEVALMGGHTSTVELLTPIFRSVAEEGLKRSRWWYEIPLELNDLILRFAIPALPDDEWKEAPQSVESREIAHHRNNFIYRMPSSGECDADADTDSMMTDGDDDESTDVESCEEESDVGM